MVAARFRPTFVWLVKANLGVWALNALLFLSALALDNSLTEIFFSGFLSKATLLETGVILLVAGAMAFLGSASATKAKNVMRKSGEEWAVENLRQSEKRANKYIFLAAILFVESLLISFSGF